MQLFPSKPHTFTRLAGQPTIAHLAKQYPTRTSCLRNTSGKHSFEKTLPIVEYSFSIQGKLNLPVRNVWKQSVVHCKSQVSHFPTSVKLLDIRVFLEERPKNFCLPYLQPGIAYTAPSPKSRRTLVFVLAQTTIATNLISAAADVWLLRPRGLATANHSTLTIISSDAKAAKNIVSSGPIWTAWLCHIACEDCWTL